LEEPDVAEEKTEDAEPQNSEVENNAEAPESSQETEPVADEPVEVVVSPAAEPAEEVEPTSGPDVEALQNEIQRLGGALQGAVEVIKDLEQPNMPPVVEGNIVIAGHLVNDFIRLGKQLDRDHLVRGNLGGLAMLHPGQPGVMLATKHMVMLASMDERSICIGQMGSGVAPRGATLDWRSFEVVLATVSMVTGGPAAAIRVHAPYTTAVSCEQDLVLVQPIDVVGKQNLGKIIIVEPDEEHPDEFLRQMVEALQQGGTRAVVIRGHGAFAVGADFNQAWANAAMLEQSMQIYLLARQANIRF
jgi:ribulose-5-phosphate 4-epimerase/fuculose-1-phosphate aldolase